jgi:serine/threonine protein kinase
MASPGDKVKHYEILDQIGKGGMGEVYLAQDTSLDRKVAIKFLPEEMQKDTGARARLVREAKAAASLDHPFICKVFETGEFEGKAYIVMEYIEGKDLKETLEGGTLSIREALQMALEIAEALEEAHEKGIIHRDLKPANIMITPRGHVKVMDFGLAKHFLTEGEGDITQTITQQSLTEHGAIVGTLAYMSPEQARGEHVDVRSDIFSLGIILYEMTTGKHPFSKANPLETLTSILRDATPPVNIKPKMMNPVLSPVLRKALAKEPENRYQNIKELIDAIHKFQKDFGGGRLRLRWWQIAAGAALIIAMIVAGMLLLPRGGPEESSLDPGSETISVLVGDFQNQTGDPIFEGTIEQTLGIGLEGAPFISLYNRAQAREQVKASDPSSEGRLSSKNAQLLSRKKEINLIVSGWIASSDKGYALTAWAMDTTKSERIAEADITIESKVDVLSAVQSLANKLIPQMRDIPPESLKKLSGEIFTATSLEAMKSYTQAQDLADQGRDEESIPFYQEAIKKDPNLGRAYAGLAVVYRNRRNKSEAIEYYQRAMTLLDQMTDREKFRTRGGYYFLNNNYKQAIQEYNELKEQYPADSAGDTNLSLAYFFTRNMQKAYEEGLRTAEREPESITPWNNLICYAIAVGKFDKADEEVKKLIEFDPTFPDAHVLLALIEIEKGRNNIAEEAYQKLASLGAYEESWASVGLADLALYEGRSNDAKKILESGISKDLKEDDKYSAAYKYTMLAHALLLQGKKAMAVEAADSAANTSKGEDILYASAQIYIQAGEEEKAKNIAEELSARVQPDPQAYAKLIEGEIMLAQGNTTEAVKLFQEAQAFTDTWLGHFALGRAFLGGEEYIEAHSEFELCLKRYGETASIFLNDLPSFHFFPPVHYYYGRTQEALNSPAAKESYDKFLKIKEKDDGSDPLVKDARRRIDNL